MIALALVSVLCAALASAAPSFDVTSRKATPSDRYLLHVEWSSPSIGATADTVDTPLWAGFNTSAPTFLYGARPPSAPVRMALTWTVAQEGAGDPKNLRGRVRASTSLATQFRSNGAFIDVVGRAAAGATQRFCGTFTLPYDLSESLIYAPRIDGPYECVALLCLIKTTLPGLTRAGTSSSLDPTSC